MPESSQHKLDRVRPPRVQITYDVEIGQAIQKKELPFVMGVLADLSGKPEDAPPPMKERKFVEIDRDNFNEVLEKAKPRLELSVPNRTKPDGGTLKVVLGFKTMDDFGPMSVIEQVEDLKKLFAARQKLNDLLAKLDGNEALFALLTRATKDMDNLKKISAASADGGAR